MEILNTKIELFREAIRRRRIELGMSQKEVAEKVGLSASTISKIELGKIEVPYSKVDAFANALGTISENLVTNQEISGCVLIGEIVAKK